LVLMTIGCQDKDKDKGEDETEMPIDEFPALYIRTNWFDDERKFPITTIISSLKELEQYCELYQGYGSTKLQDAISAYSDDFFASNFLVIVMLQEGSGSIRHKVEKMKTNSDIAIYRLLPYAQSADMAMWNIIMEFSNDHGTRQFHVRLIDKKLY